MKAVLTLHEAIVVVLIGREDRTASIDEIVDEINKRGLYFQRAGTPTNSSKVGLRTKPSTKSGKFYSYLFEHIGLDKVRLRNV